MAEERVHRRLAAVLAADVAGYSRLVGADEEGTLAWLNALRIELLHPKVSEYGGRIVKTINDGTLMKFPSAVGAVSRPMLGLLELLNVYLENLTEIHGCDQLFPRNDR